MPCAWSIMVPLYLAAEVAWLGAAKIALGWPLWVASIALMGWLLVAGHTPLEPGEGPGAEDHAVTDPERRRDHLSPMRALAVTARPRQEKGHHACWGHATLEFGAG